MSASQGLSWTTYFTVTALDYQAVHLALQSHCQLDAIAVIWEST